MNCNRCFYCGGLLSLVLECNQRSFGLVNPIALYVLVITRVYVEFYSLCCLQFTKTLKIWYNGLLLHSILIDRVHVHIMLVNDIKWKSIFNWRRKLFEMCFVLLCEGYLHTVSVHWYIFNFGYGQLAACILYCNYFFYLSIILKCSVYPYPFDGWQFSKE